MKIKTKKQLNLPQLIEWGFEQKELPPLFYGSREGSLVQFTPGGWVNITGIEPTDTFTVEVEEEITLTTPLPAMLHVWKTGILGTEIKEVENKSIASQYTVCSTEFWLKQDDEMTLIWRDGRLIE